MKFLEVIKELATSYHNPPRYRANSGHITERLCFLGISIECHVKFGQMNVSNCKCKGVFFSNCVTVRQF